METMKEILVNTGRKICKLAFPVAFALILLAMMLPQATPVDAALNPSPNIGLPVEGAIGTGASTNANSGTAMTVNDC